ncbi:hypothetical protein pW4_57 [Bacillus phage pW4]|uniref:Uncharacterized protein n=1 Tax=Bacillus phage pW4 TaxID=2500560 RepID=A0A3Q9R7M8_9CAUD|nr:hypothetical protein PP656_gp077 [Bacillus phage pW4]AZU99077.1 hypothetical protein pW4_57 [Bacillus phage pW4]
MKWLYVKEDHMTRFFGTKWNSKVSLKRWHKTSLGKRGLYFHEGYVELCLGNWVLRYRNNK